MLQTHVKLCCNVLELPLYKLEILNALNLCCYSYTEGIYIFAWFTTKSRLQINESKIFYSYLYPVVLLSLAMTIFNSRSMYMAA